MAHTIVIFGASGDLTSRKLIPALYSLYRKKRLPPETRIVGVSRTEFSHEAWRNALTESTRKFTGETFDNNLWRQFAQNIYYVPGNIKQEADFLRLKDQLLQIEGEEACSRLYYLSTMPSLYEVAVAGLGAAGLAEESCGERRVIIEKPFGVDLESAQALNAAVHQVFGERQVYRIDHYLGKETVQNMLVLRFANSIFEPLWNRNYIDHVQITVAEEVEVKGRGAYYDGSGVLRDMFQNHLLQLLMITAMEAPVRFEADLVRDEKVKVLRSMRKLQPQDYVTRTVRGQYAGYQQVEGVADNSQTATFAALKLAVDNWRWKGVPFYLRSGKAMSCRTTQIVIQFREPPHMMFADGRKTMHANRLLIQIQPAEGIELEFQTKVPDQGMKLITTGLDMQFAREFTGEMPDAYQRLLLDALNGDASLFARSDEVELAWSIIDPVFAAWDSGHAPPLHTYPSGQWGPQESWEWMQQQKGRQWFDVCPVLK